MKVKRQGTGRGRGKEEKVEEGNKDKDTAKINLVLFAGRRV